MNYLFCIICLILFVCLGFASKGDVERAFSVLEDWIVIPCTLLWEKSRVFALNVCGCQTCGHLSRSLRLRDLQENTLMSNDVEWNLQNAHTTNVGCTVAKRRWIPEFPSGWTNAGDEEGWTFYTWWNYVQLDHWWLHQAAQCHWSTTSAGGRRGG